MKKAQRKAFPKILDKEIAVRGKLIRIASLRSEYFENIDDIDAFVSELKSSNIKADLLAFSDGVAFSEIRRNMALIYEPKAVLEIDTYDEWWKSTINDKTRNMVRKGGKKGIEIRPADYDSNFVEGIQSIYNESPIRQGRPFHHYGMDLNTVEEAHKKFNENSDLIGAYFGDELVGFIKLVHLEGYSVLMQIISKIEHRNKAPTNALIAKAVEICAQKGVPKLMYGMWSRRTLGYFKKHHGFKRFEVPKYFVPLNLRGKIALILKFHYPLKEKIIDFFPDKWILAVTNWRNKWHLFRLKKDS